jgi:hypothetical protein
MPPRAKSPNRLAPIIAARRIAIASPRGVVLRRHSMTISRLLLLATGIACTALPAFRAAESATTMPWKAGAAVVDITPDGPMWLAGYGGRNRPSEGVAQRLFAKALAIEDGAGAQMVFVTLDLIHVPRALREGVESAVAATPTFPHVTVSAGVIAGIARSPAVTMKCFWARNGSSPAGRNGGT